MVLSIPLTMEEIRMAIQALKNDKARGPDGIPIEFYKKNVDWIYEDLFSLYKEAFEKGSLGNKINSHVINLTPKDGYKTLIKNWIPLTLLNISYKILAKRLEKVLPKVVNNTQSILVKGRYILENLLTYWESMHWAMKANQNSAMMLLDFEKAYDKIEWKFVFMVLESMRFPNFLCQMVKTNERCISLCGC